MTEFDRLCCVFKDLMQEKNSLTTTPVFNDFYWLKSEIVHLFEKCEELKIQKAKDTQNYIEATYLLLTAPERLHLLLYNEDNTDKNRCAEENIKEFNSSFLGKTIKEACASCIIMCIYMDVHSNPKDVLQQMNEYHLNNVTIAFVVLYQLKHNKNYCVGLRFANNREKDNTPYMTLVTERILARTTKITVNTIEKNTLWVEYHPV